jgi:hypothetical protein
MQIYSAEKKIIIKGKRLDLLVLIYNHCCYTNSVAKTGKHYKITKPIPCKFSELKKFLKQQGKN